MIQIWVLQNLVKAGIGTQAFVIPVSPTRRGDIEARESPGARGPASLAYVIAKRQGRKVVL